MLVAATLLGCGSASAQHTLGFTAGYGMSNGRFQPPQEMKAIWGQYSAGLTWRYYGTQRVVGGFGIDLEFLQQGFSYATNASRVDEPADYLYYTRKVNSLVLPIVWQPHVYLFNHRMRVYLEAAATFSYNLSSTYENEQARAEGLPDWKGTYESGRNATTGSATDWPAAVALRSLSSGSSSISAYATTSAIRTSCAIATNTPTTRPTDPKIRFTPHRCGRRSTT